MACNSSQDWQVFISCKVSDENDEYTRDWYIAKELYELLKANSIRVFMSSFSIEELGEAAYKEVIEEALDKALVMVVVGTTKENLNSKWVKYEWDSFHNEIISGRKLDGQILTVTDELANSDLPYALRQNQTYKTSGKARLLNFIKRKLESFDSRESIPVEETVTKGIEEDEHLEIDDRSNETSIDVPVHEPEEASADKISEEIKEEIEEEKAEETLRDTPQEAPEEKTEESGETESDRTEEAEDENLETDDRSNETSMDVSKHEPEKASADTSTEEMKEEIEEEKAEETLHDIPREELEEKTDQIEETGSNRTEEDENLETVDKSNETSIDVSGHEQKKASTDKISEEIKKEIEEEKAEETLRDIPQEGPEDNTDHHETPVKKRRIALPLFIFFTLLVTIAIAVMSLQDHPPGSSSKENSKPEITLTSPINGITGIHPDRITLKWIGKDSDGDEISYKVYFGETSNPGYVSTTHSNQLTITNKDWGKKYYWRVQASDNHGGTTTSQVYSFATKENKAPIIQSNPGPSDKATNQQLTLTLGWTCNEPDGDTVTYDVYFGTGSNPSTKISSNQTDNKLNKSNLSQGTTYYWKVVAKDSKGATTEGPIWRFTTRSNEAPKAPSNPSPTNDSINQPLVLSLSWDCDDADGDSVTYDVYFGTSSDLRVKESTGNSAKSINKSGLSYNTTYYWKVVAKDSKGATTEGPIWKFTTSKVPEGMVLVEKGSFIMGDSSGLGFDRERPAHEVIIDYEFVIGKYEITFDEYDVFCRDTDRESANDEGWGRGRRPVINVTWYDAVAYCNWLSDLEGVPKAYDENGKLLDKNGRVTDDPSKVMGYRLPTEAEWEYAAKGGASISLHRYSGGDEVGKVAWYYSNSFGKTQEVGKKTCNELGLFDMSGNVWEWCSDSYHDDFYSRSSGNNPYNNDDSSFRVSRGGGFNDSANYLRVESRFYYNTLTAAKDLGFRICRTVF